MGSEVRSADTDYCPESTTVDLVQADERIKERHQGRFSWRLFESLLRVLGKPILIVALDRIVDIKAEGGPLVGT